ncbi:hypothetical protein D3C76_922080 [compost metagenome]
MHVQAFGDQFGGRLLHAFGEDVGDHHLGTGAADGLGKGVTQSAGATGDQHAAAFEQAIEGGHHWVLNMALGM